MADLLVVEDDKDIAELLALFLELQGNVVRQAEDGEVGLKMVRESYPDLILLDVDMPRLSGPEMAYRLIIEDSGKENIPILLVSGINNLAEVAAAIGTPYFLAKPFKLEDIQRLVHLALKQRQRPRPFPSPIHEGRGVA